MSGSAASLGLRTGSYGSLPAAVGGSGGGGVVRKTGGRGWALRGEKERLQLLHRALRLVGRRRAGVLLLLAVASAAVFCSLFAVVKDDSSSISIVNNYEVPNAIQKSVYPSTTRPLMMSGNQYSSVVNKIEIPNRLHLSYANFTHPCEGFSVPPPLVDKKRTGPRHQAFALMPLQASTSPVLKNLNYISEEGIIANLSSPGSAFGGHPSLEQRNESFNINESMTVHCGFVRGKKPGQGTGFDIKDDDLLEMEQCRELVVASAIFDVPEGCVIIREHIPITNLFTCLWFNEVDRFTSRDQISFSTVRDKIRARVGWMPEMFLDCERRNFVVQAYHRELLEQMIASGRKPPSTTDAPPSRKLRPGSRKAPPSKKPSVKRKKEKKSSSRRRVPKPLAGGMGAM
nr:unnamed protein product [Digitaria exilis]